ncbi:MAG: caspase family protein [Gammaproteobacteria bacterium]
MRIVALRWLAGLLCVLPLAASQAGGLLISAQTKTCSGSTGLASFDVDKLFKIQDGYCDDPDKPGTKLKQVLVRSHSGLTQYDVLWVTEQEVGKIQQRIDAYMAARVQGIAGAPATVIINEPAPPPVSQPASQPAPPPPVAKAEPVSRPAGKQEPASPPPVAQPAPRPPAVVEEIPPKVAGLSAPSIEIIDPPVSNTRGTQRIITRSGVGARVVVGRVEARSGLLTLSVNGEEHGTDAEGLFRVNVPVDKADNPVAVVAIDKQGRRTAVEFTLVPETVPRPPEAAEQPRQTDGAGFGDYHALVIGNNRYPKFRDLATAVNDAQIVGAILRDKYGFKVTELLNATRSQTLDALNDLRKQLTEKDNLLLYYAGHGEYDTVNLRGHWLPVDAESDSNTNWISTIAVTDILNQMSAKHVLVVADSCYSGALTRTGMTEMDPGMSDDARQRWLRVMAKSRSRTVLTSGGVRPVLDSGGGTHSVFARAFIDTLRKNRTILEGSRLFADVKKQVMNATSGLEEEQVPEYAPLKRSDHEFSDFLLVRTTP